VRKSDSADTHVFVGHDCGSLTWIRFSIVSKGECEVGAGDEVQNIDGGVFDLTFGVLSH
jgi:hypothetical protein